MSTVTLRYDAAKRLYRILCDCNHVHLEDEFVHGLGDVIETLDELPHPSQAWVEIGEDHVRVTVDYDL